MLSDQRDVERMRILFTGVPGHGHLLPLLPLARAFERRQTDDVAIMVPRTYVPVFAEEDMDVLPAGAENPTVIDEVIRRTGEDVRGDATRETMVEAFTTARIDLSADECLSAAREWRPDLIVHDPMDYVGQFLAAACDVPRAVHTFGSDVSADFIRATTERAVKDFEGRGVWWRRASWVLDICPSVLQVDGWQAPPGWLSLRPEAHRAPDTVASRTAKPLTAVPRVLLTFGTLYTNPEVLSPLLRELAARGAGLRVTTGTTTSPDDFAVDHDLVTFEDFLPYDELLKDIDVVVAHGGSGTSLGALAAGIPLVLAPQGADQGGQAERAAAAGAAILIAPEELSPGAVARAVADVLGQPGYRTSAVKVADQIAAMPSPDDVAANLASALT